MTLANKILILFAFMGSVTFIVFCWFGFQFYHHATRFHASFEKETQVMKADFDKAKRELEKKAEGLKESISEQLKKVEEGLRKNR